MGNNCGPLSGDNTTEVNIGQGAYRFKKKVSKICVNNTGIPLLLYASYIIQLLPQNDSQRLYYEKSTYFDNHIKGQILPSSTLGRSASSYNNGTIKVIIPVQSASSDYFNK